MKYTFQHYVDVSTSASGISMIQIQAGGEYTMQRTKHLLGAYKYVKLGRVSVKLLPASTLPVDPLGLSYDSSDPQTVDPRDQMNPGLVRITNGEDLFDDFTGVPAAAQEQMYINTMLDPRWSKFMLQSGFKRSAVPLYWNVGQLHQDPYPGTVMNMPYPSTSANITRTDTFTFADPYASAGLKTGPSVNVEQGTSDPRGFFQTGHRGRMGWMPTDAFYDKIYNLGDSTAINHADVPMAMPIPEVNVITVIFPKAYKTVYYYRMFITETVYFSGLKNVGINAGQTDSEYRALDNFAYVPEPQYYPPSSGRPNTLVGPNPPNTGGE